MLTMPDKPGTTSDMSSTCDGLRTRLAGVSVQDINAVHVLHTEIGKEVKRVDRYSDEWRELTTLWRRADRKLGLALQAAQRDGRLAVRGDRRGYLGSPADFASDKPRGMMNRLANLSEQDFEAVLTMAAAASENGAPSLRAADAAARGIQLPPRPEVKPTARGQRLINSMAVSMMSIADGLDEFDPREIDAEQFSETIDRVFNDLGKIRAFLRRVNGDNDR